MHEQIKLERKRLQNKIFDFCMGEMADKGCLECPVNECKVCDEGKGGKLITMEKLKEAERIIDEVSKTLRNSWLTNQTTEPLP